MGGLPIQLPTDTCVLVGHRIIYPPSWTFQVVETSRVLNDADQRLYRMPMQTELSPTPKLAPPEWEKRKGFLNLCGDAIWAEATQFLNDAHDSRRRQRGNAEAADLRASGLRLRDRRGRYFYRHRRARYGTLSTAAGKDTRHASPTMAKIDRHLRRFDEGEV